MALHANREAEPLESRRSRLAHRRMDGVFGPSRPTVAFSGINQIDLDPQPERPGNPDLGFQPSWTARLYIMDHGGVQTGHLGQPTQGQGPAATLRAYG